MARTRSSSSRRRVPAAFAALAALLVVLQSGLMPVDAVEKPTTTTSLAEDIASSSGAAAAAAAPSASAAASEWTAPAYCKGNECARFKLLEGGTQKFEVREYAPAVWSTATFPAGTSWDEVRSKGFDRNFKYIQGAGVAMTAPVLTRLSGDGSFSVSFLVPSKYGTSPPAPKPGSEVKIQESPSRRVVVRSWVGTDPKFESKRDVDAAFAALMADADAAGLIVGAPPSEGGLQGWTAGYDSPMTDPAKRRHEVWLPLVARKSEVAPADKGKVGGGGMIARVAAASVAAQQP